MGAKTAVKLRNRGAAFKCDLCGRKLMTPDALVAHQRTAHNIVTRRTKPKQIIKAVKSAKVEVKEKPVKKTLTPLKRTPKSNDKKVKIAVKNETKSESKDESKDQSKDEANEESKPEKRERTVEFECPKCLRVFLTYFPALKHIQKFHCVNRQGQKVPPNSASLIQPVRIELCLKCKRKVKSIQTHICDNTVKGKSEEQVFICTACDQWYPNLKSFDIHVLSLHSDEVESMFFPTSSEFTKWKLDMEVQTNTSYAILDKYDSKKYYHCNSVKADDTKTRNTNFCPSTIVIHEFSKGIQVHFYKQHFKHTFVDYLLTDKYKKYSIMSFLNRSEEYNNLPKLESDDNDMYLQFKTLMEGIVVDAAKINITTLKILVGKALDMTSILTNYDEEVDESNTIEVRNTNQTMNDSQITKALEDTLNTGKRKNNNKIETISEIKKIKFDSINDENSMDTSSPKILNSFSLADNVDALNKLNEDQTVTSENVIDKIKTNSTESKSTKQLKDIDQSPSSFNDSYKNFVVKNFPSKDAEVKTRNRAGRAVVKTKIGQYKPNTSPKSPVTEALKIESNVSKRLSIDKPKVDFEYEVKEQEEGCNILILKI